MSLVSMCNPSPALRGLAIWSWTMTCVACSERTTAVAGDDCEVAQAAAVAAPWDAAFETTTLSTAFVSEGASVGDIDGDGVLDLVAGPHWYAGPCFQTGGVLFDAPALSPDEYSTFFLTFVDDLDRDGDTDVIAIGGPGGVTGLGESNAHWYENPGTTDLERVWAKHLIFDGVVSNESPTYLNVVGDEQRELVFMTEQQLGYATPGATAQATWTFHPVSERVFNTPFVHGLGVGDINGDGLIDLVEATGWWEQPTAQASLWIRHPADFALGGQGGAQMIVYDVDGDLDADVVTSLNAHGYGLAWFEQADVDTFVHHEILPVAPGGDSFSQLHALAAGDLNGDGLLDIVSGKRYYAHPSSTPDPGTTDPAVLVWFELSRAGGVSFLPHLIHNDSGIGCNFAVVDVNADARPDVFASNKRGTFLHTQR